MYLYKIRAVLYHRIRITRINIFFAVFDHYPVFLSDAETTVRLPGSVVVHRDFTVIQKYFQVFLLVKTVAEPFMGLAFQGILETFS